MDFEKKNYAWKTISYTDYQNSTYLKKENVYIGILFASKPIVQILFNMFVGPLVDRIGFDVPMFCGYVVLTSSCLRKLNTISVEVKVLSFF